MRYDSLTITLVYICPVMQYYICSIVIIIEAICVVHSPKTQICSMFPIVAQKNKLGAYLPAIYAYNSWGALLAATNYNSVQFSTSNYMESWKQR